MVPSLSGSRLRRRGGDACVGPQQSWVPETYAGEKPNDRHRNVLNRVLDGFEGSLANAEWAALTKSSSDTVLRDIDALAKRGILVKEKGGCRSTSYSLARLE